MGINSWISRSFVSAVAALVVAVTLVSFALAALAGDFSRPAVAVVMLIVGGLFLLVGAVTSGAMPFLGSIPGTDPGINYTNTLQTELQLQQSLQHETVRADLARRRRLGLRMLAAGGALVIIALLIA